MEIKYNTKKKLSIDIVACAIWSLFVLVVSGCSFALMNPVRIAILVIGFAGVSYFILKNEGAAKEDRIMAVITIMAIGVRTLYVLYTGAEQRQHDIGGFEVDSGLVFHSEYIEYILNNHALLNEDIRLHSQFYHPPLTHIVSAVFFGIYRKAAPAYAHNWDALQCLSLFYSLVTLAIFKRFTGFWKLSEKGRMTACLTAAFFPQFIYFSGALNNDPLSVMFAFASIYLAVSWYNDEKKSFLKLIGMSLCIGFGMMAKLSAGLVAVPIAVIMLKAFFETKTKIRMFFEYVAFLAVCAPLGLWYQVRNYILWKVPILYVTLPDIDPGSRMYIGPMPLWHRFFDFGPDVDHNILIETIYTACVDGEYYYDCLPLAWLARFLVMAYACLSVTVIINLVITWAKEHDFMNLVMTVLLASQLASYVLYSIKYPYTCSMSFRFIVPSLIAVAYYSGKSIDKAPKIFARFTNATVCAVAFFSFILYCFTWLLDC